MNLKEVPQPNGVYLVVKEIPETEEDLKTKSGIYLTTESEDKGFLTRAEVMAVGFGGNGHDMRSSVGDIILVNKKRLQMTDVNFRVNGEAMYMVSEFSDVYGWISKKYSTFEYESTTE